MIIDPQESHCAGIDESLKEVNKGVWGMPRLSEAKKDVISCDKLRGSANRNYIRRFPNGATQSVEDGLSKQLEANPGN